jgi:glycerate dehydrogenase
MMKMNSNQNRNIVVTDGHTLNPGDLTWDGVAALGALTVHERTRPEEIVARCRDAAIVVTNKVAFNRDTFAALPNLRCIAVTATGYNVVDVAAARERGIVVCNVPEYGTDSVAQFVFALLLELAHRVGEHSRGVHAGRWTRSVDFCYWDGPLVELRGKTLGIVGCGRIGRATARIAGAFGMRVIGTAPRAGQSDADLTRVDLDTLLRESDVVSLHCPLLPDTRGLINAAALAKMKPTAFLINTSRGPLVDEAALADALRAGRLAGAAMDVLSSEPPAAANPLLGLENCVITPHIAWATHAARGRLMQTTVDNITAFLRGHPLNVVS